MFDNNIRENIVLFARFIFRLRISFYLMNILFSTLELSEICLSFVVDSKDKLFHHSEEGNRDCDGNNIELDKLHTLC